MRKDLRYGLGIGALLLAFVVTYLVVRNHSEKQAIAENGGQEQPAEGSPGGGSSSPAEANPSSPAPADGAAPNAAAALTPLAPMPGPSPRPGGNVSRPPIVPPPSPGDEPFAPRPSAPKGRANGVSASAKSNGQDWDSILSEPPKSGGTVTRTPTALVGPRAGNDTPQSPTSDRRRDAVVFPHPPGAVLTQTGRPYTIQEGDTFVSIAQAAYGNSKYFLQIERANPNVNPNRLKIGQQIILPEISAQARASRPPSHYPLGHERPINPRTEYRVDTNDSLYRISLKVYGTHRMLDTIYELNKATIGPDPEKLKEGMILKLPQGQASK